MNEQVARQVVLMRAIECTDTHHELLSEDDRRFATRSARELAQWRMSEGGKRSAAEHFLEQRAEQVLRRLGERHPGFAAVVRPRPAGRWFTALIMLAAFITGALVDRVGDPHGVDLLSLPLLGILAWNVLMYAILLVWALWPGDLHGWAKPRLTRWLVAQSMRAPRRVPKVLGIAWTAFTAEWQGMSAALNRQRLSRAMHLAAAAFAAGAMLSLYARGILQHYAPTWESTFLDAAQVHQLLSLLFAPAMAVFPLQGFTLADVQRLGMGAAALPGEGARWVHLYAATLALLVVLPRLVLALISHLRAGWIKRRFPLALNDPYFVRLAAESGAPSIAAVRVLPYSYELDEVRQRGLDAVLRGLFGETVRVIVRPSLRYGEETKVLLRDVDLSDKDVGATVLLFSLAATPERENQGACIAALASTQAAQLTVLVDSAPLAERGPIPEARVTLWRDFCKAHGIEPVLVNLADAGRGGSNAVSSGARG
jgi:hypothetical protein